MPPNVPQSPFFAPSTPRKLVQVSTPGGTSRIVKKESSTSREHKSTVAGATSNLVNAIIGAGIVGIPYAIKETGLVAGVLLVVLCAVLTDKSLRLLVNTAKHVSVPSYETLFESTYGSFGFYFISINMLIMAYGGCLSYLMIIKDTLPILLGIEKDDVGMERAILTVSTMAIILPISMQRDMADLAKTSKISVLFQCTMVLVVVIFSPVSDTVRKNGGLLHIASNSIVKTPTLFVGLGVLSFAYVCQHGAFIVAGSLDHPTKERWGMATSRALTLCLILEVACGVAGYLAFLDETEGDILNNFLDLGGLQAKRSGNIARGLMCTTMFFVYPLDSFVCRHVLVVLFFRGRRAHEGDDASVLSRKDRRVAITLIVYFSCLIPAMIVDSVGSVLAVTGTIGASCLAYIGPGLIYMAVYGGEFLKEVEEFWGTSEGESWGKVSSVVGVAESSQLLRCNELAEKTLKQEYPPSALQKLAKAVAWYTLLMPVWCLIANMGRKKLSDFQEKEALKSPHINRLGKCAPVPQVEMPRPRAQIPRGGLSSDAISLPAGSGPKILPYGAIMGGNKAIGAAILAKKQSKGGLSGTTSQDVENEADIDIPPTRWDFFIAIFFIAFGMVALCAGMISILMSNAVVKEGRRSLLLS